MSSQKNIIDFEQQHQLETKNCHFQNIIQKWNGCIMVWTPYSVISKVTNKQISILGTSLTFVLRMPLSIASNFLWIETTWNHLKFSHSESKIKITIIFEKSLSNELKN